MRCDSHLVSHINTFWRTGDFIYYIWIRKASEVPAVGLWGCIQQQRLHHTQKKSKESSPWSPAGFHSCSTAVMTPPTARQITELLPPPSSPFAPSRPHTSFLPPPPQPEPCASTASDWIPTGCNDPLGAGRRRETSAKQFSLIEGSQLSQIRLLRRRKKKGKTHTQKLQPLQKAVGERRREEMK